VSLWNSDLRAYLDLRVSGDGYEEISLLELKAVN
jgi:hypothetical protein